MNKIKIIVEIGMILGIIIGTLGIYNSNSSYNIGGYILLFLVILVAWNQRAIYKFL